MITAIHKKATALSYIVSLIILYFVINQHSQAWSPSPVALGQKLAIFFLFALCLFAIDWIVKQQYWASQGNYHLFVFVMGIFSLPKLPVENWITLYFFLLWVAYIHLLNACQSDNDVKGLFNAGFLLFLASFFFPEGIVLFPIVWVILLIHEAISTQTLTITLLPLFALLLLEVFLVELLPGFYLFPGLEASNIRLTSPWKQSIIDNFWWGSMLILFFLAIIRQNIDINSKGASYRAGMLSLIALGLTGILVALFFAHLSPLAWLLFIMVLAAISSRFFEEIKRVWISELLFLVYIAGILLSKTRLFFF